MPLCSGPIAPVRPPPPLTVPRAGAPPPFPPPDRAAFAPQAIGTEAPPSEELFLAGDTVRDRMMRALSRTSMHDSETGMVIRGSVSRVGDCGSI